MLKKSNKSNNFFLNYKFIENTNLYLNPEQNLVDFYFENLITIPRNVTHH